MRARDRWIATGLVLAMATGAWILFATRSRDFAPEEHRPELTSLPATAQRIEPVVAPAVRDETELPSTPLVAPAAARSFERVLLRIDVRNPKGQAIAGADAVLRDGKGGTWKAKPAADGTYEIADLPLGSLTLNLSADHHARVRVVITITGVSAEQRHDVVLLPSHDLAIRFVDENGEPIAQRLISPGWPVLPLGAVATATPPPRRLATVAGGVHDRYGLGSFRTDSNPRGVGQVAILSIAAEPPYFVSATLRNFVLTTVPVVELVEELELRVPRQALDGLFAGLRARLFDAESGSAIPDATIAFDTFSDGIAYGTQTEGAFLLELLPPGLGRVRLRAEGFASKCFCVSLEPGATRDLGTMAMEREFALRIRLENAAGETLKGDLYCHDLGIELGADRLTYYAHFPVTHLPQEFLVPSLGRSRYLLTAYHRGSGAMARELVDLRTSPVEPVRLVLRPTHELVIDPRFDDSDSPLLRILDERSLPLYEYYAATNGPVRLQAFPGPHRIEIWDDDVLARSIAFRMEPGPTRVVVSR